MPQIGESIDAPTLDKSVLVGLSGGVDSSVAAFLLKEAGANVTGVTFDLNENTRNIEEAQAVAQFLGIEHLVVDMRQRFEHAIIRPFIAGYSRASTPNPCIECNLRMKWAGLLETADKHGIEMIATGHFARIEKGLVHRGIDPDKDQSYFLYRIQREWLSRTVFPLGEFFKSDVKQLARQIGLPLSDRAESNDICFMKKGMLARFLSEAGVSDKPGEIVDVNGRTLGKHSGWASFTPGQRRGLGVASAEGRLYVVEIDPAEARIVLGPREALLKRTFEVENTIFHERVQMGDSIDCDIQIRHLGEVIRGKVRRTDELAGEVSLERGIFAPARGQSAVFYREDAVIGGGYILV